MVAYKPPYYSSAGYYFNKGFNVIPLIPKGKKAVVKWKSFATEKMTPKQINYFKQYYPHHNIGIITGKVSRLAIVDVDGEEGRESLKEYMMPQTLRVETSRGFHLYYKLPILENLPSTNSLLPKIDVKADGGYVVAPPSLTYDGKAYTWSESPAFLKDIPQIPDWIIQKIKLREQGLLPKGNKAVQQHQKRKEWLKDLLKGVDTGKRNESCARYAGYLISKGYGEDACIKELFQWNLKNVPPLEEKEIMSVFYSVFNRDKIRTYQSIEPIDLSKAKENIKNWLHFEDDTLIDVTLATAVSYNYEVGPIWLVIIAPPSSGKTEILRSLRGYRDTVFMESITSRTLFSGMYNKRGILERHNQPYLLMINKDFGSILAKGGTEKSAILQQLRGIFDQDYVDETGGMKQAVEWSNRVNFLSAATQDIESKENQRYIGDLGERFLYYKMRAETDDSIRKKALSAITNKSGDKRMRAEVSAAMLGVLKACEGKDPDDIHMPSNILEWLVELCMVAVKMRTRVKRDPQNHNVVEYKPSPEGIMRMLKSIKGLLIGIAMIRGRKQVQVSDYGLAARVVIDSVPSYRKIGLKILYFSKSWLKIKELTERLGMTDHTAKLTLEDLVVVGLAEKHKEELKFGQMQGHRNLYRIKPGIYKSVKQSGMEGLL